MSDEVIAVHKDSWSHRELMGRILSRYCYVLEDIGGCSPAYVVSEKDDEDMHCLLYTSPSPRDATLARMPSSA